MVAEVNVQTRDDVWILYDTDSAATVCPHRFREEPGTRIDLLAENTAKRNIIISELISTLRLRICGLGYCIIFAVVTTNANFSRTGINFGIAIANSCCFGINFAEYSHDQVRCPPRKIRGVLSYVPRCCGAQDVNAETATEARFSGC